MAIASCCVGRGSRRSAFSKASRQASRSRRKSAITARSSATRASVVAPSCVAVVALFGKGGKTRWSSAGSICQPFVSSRCAEIRPALMDRLNAAGGIVTLRSGSEQIEGRSLVFTGRVYLYSERPISDELRQPLLAQAKAQGHSLIFRSVQYVTERNRWEKPRAFISHDSRDKTAIAEPLAAELQNLRCPVWFDKFSLKVGDSLRQSITATSQRGLSPRPAQVSPDGPRYFGGTFLPFNALLRCPPRAVLSPPSKAIRSNCFCNSTRWSRSL
jgi:hypothetical protein